MDLGEAALGAVLIIILLVLIVLALAIALFVFWLMMLIDCAKREFDTDSERIVWILIIIFLGIIGAAVYYFAIKKAPKKKSR